MKGTIGERDDWFIGRSVIGTTGVEGRLNKMVDLEDWDDWVETEVGDD